MTSVKTPVEALKLSWKKIKVGEDKIHVHDIIYLG